MIAVIVVMGIVGLVAGWAVRSYLVGLQEQVAYLKQRQNALLLELTKLQGQLVIEGVLPVWGERFLNDAPHCGIVVTVTGRRRLLLSARVERLERLLARLCEASLTARREATESQDVIAVLRYTVAELRVRHEVHGGSELPGECGPPRLGPPGSGLR
jgi:hypothetical protein